MEPISKDALRQALAELDIIDVNCATIRQICSLAAKLEEISGEKFVHLEIGNPGLAAEQAGIEAQCRALRSGVPNTYPNIVGIKELKQNGSRFVKAFIDVDIPARCIVPTVGSMQGSFTLMMLLSQRLAGRDTMLLIEPGFPAQRHQAKILGMKTESFDIYNYRGARLRDKLEEILSKGHVTGMIYSNPNNPAWTNLTDEELSIIGEMATKYDVVVLEDLAYMGMDFRLDLSRPYEPPFVPTVKKYTDNCILLISASKIFSYAGERVAMVCMTPQVWDRHYDYFAKFYDLPAFGDSYTYGVLYTCSSGVCHSAQYAMAAMLGEAVEGKLNFVDECREYGRRAHRAKQMFADAGFHLCYDKDGDRPISDGFFFTTGYKDLAGDELQLELLRYGIAAIPLKSTGSKRQGVRVTVSKLSDEDLFSKLDERLKRFVDEH